LFARVTELQEFSALTKEHFQWYIIAAINTLNTPYLLMRLHVSFSACLLLKSPPYLKGSKASTLAKGNLFAMANDVLKMGDPEEKVRLSHRIQEQWRNGIIKVPSLSDFDEEIPPISPSRPPSPLCVHPAKIPSHKQGSLYYQP
jgi:hypothetical protein